MNRSFLAAACAALALFASAPAEAATRNFTVTSFTRIRVDGPYRVTLATGIAPFASASGSPQALDALMLDMQGNTLVVHVNRNAWTGFDGDAGGPVTISLGTHDLSSAWLNGAGSLAIDRVKALRFDLSVQGAGLASIASVAVDQFKIALGGAASARLAGEALNLDALVRGSSTLDAASLSTHDAVITAEGPAVVKVAVSNAAKIDALGVAAVTLTGSPACTAKTTGSSFVEGCRPAR